MIYVGRPERNEAPHHALIDPTKPVTSPGDDLLATGMPYWPNYSSIDPRCRSTYLAWLSGGRSDPGYGVGYVFLYFYGLERRFFIDEPDEAEKRALVTEVKRLLDIYGENASVRRYLGAFLDAARAVLIGDADTAGPIFERQGWELPLTVRVAIGHILARGATVPAEWMLSWLMTHPEVWLRTPAERAFPEFKALFVHRLGERFPDGLKIAVPKRKLSPRYQAASGAFERTLPIGTLPDIAGLKKPVEIAREVADSAVEDLDKFSRYLGRNPDGRGTIEAHALLPDAIKPSFPCEELEGLRRWLERYVAEGGFVPLADLLQRLEGAPPQRVGKSQLVGAADALAMLGFGYAPDPRFSLRGPRLDEKVKLFALPENTPRLEETSPNYRAMLLEIAVGSFLAHADGNISHLERRKIEDRIQGADGFAASERARLLGNLDWALTARPDFALLKRHAKETTDEMRQDLGRLALSVAGADGHIDPGEIEAIRKLYGALGLDAGGIYAALHALAAESEPVTVYRPARTEEEYAIPTPPPTAGGSRDIRLDTLRIKAIMADTVRVSGVLHAIFMEDEAVAADPDAIEPDADRPRHLDGLDHKHRSLIQELVRAPIWPPDSFDKLARQFGLMPAGALEAINEWAFDRFEEALIEETDGLEVNPSIAAQLAA